MDEGVRVCAPLPVTSRPVSRVLSWIIIHLGRKSPPGLERPTRKRRGPRHGFPIWSCSGWGLPCRSRYRSRGALLPHHFTLTDRGRRYTFCCTGRGLAPPRRYLAPCPAEPGLSSSPRGDQRLSGRLGVQFYEYSGPRSNNTGNIRQSLCNPAQASRAVVASSMQGGRRRRARPINLPAVDKAPAGARQSFPPAA